MAEDKQRSTNWGGKRTGAGRHQTAMNNSKTRSIYCSSQEFRRLKRFLAFERALQSDTAENSDTIDSGAFSEKLQYKAYRAFLADNMDDNAWENFREYLRPDTVKRLEAYLAKESKQ